MRSVEENKTEVFASLVYDGIFCFADESSVIMVYDWICREVWTTISTTQSSTGTMEAGEKLEHVHLLAAQLGSISLAEWKKQLSMHAIPLAGIWCHFLLQPDVGSSDGDKLHWEWERQREGGSCKAAGGRVEVGGWSWSYNEGQWW